MNYNYGDNPGFSRNKSPDVFKGYIYAEKTYILMSSGPSGMHCCLTMKFPTLTSRFLFQA